MADRVRDQMIKKGLVSRDETPEARRAAARQSAAPAVEKSLPPPFEAPARGVIVGSRARPPAARICDECGASLPLSQRTVGAAHRCAECTADSA